MSFLFPPVPVFLDLAGRAVIVCAGDARAAAFVADCLEAGAGVTILHPQPGPAMVGVAPRARLLLRRWRAADFRNAAVVAFGADDRRMTQARASAKAARAIFIVLDGGPGSDVSLGETTARGPLTVGVSAVGLPEPLASALRARIEAAAPPRLSAFLEAAARFGGGPAGLNDASQRRRFWEQALAAAVKLRAHGWSLADWDAWLAERATAALTPASREE